MIRRVQITGYKSLRGIDVHLEPLTIVVGPNAVGKSNLFDALGLLSRMVTSRTLSDAFSAHRGAPLEAFSVGPGGIPELLENGHAEFTMVVDVYLSDFVVQKVERIVKEMRQGVARDDERERQKIIERYLRYRITVEILTDSGHLRVKDEQLAALNKDGTLRKSRNLFYEKQDDNKIILRMEGQAHPISYDIGLNYTIASTPLYPPHYPHVAALREELSRWRFYYLEPSAMRKDNELKEVDSLGSSGNDLAAFYNILKKKFEKRFQAINRSVSQILPSIDGINVEKTDQGYLRLLITENGTLFPASVVSEGTLRVLGLLAITHPIAPLSVVGYEEPENGVHPGRLKLISNVLNSANQASNGTQFIVNTHSPLLPAYFDTNSILTCRRIDGFTVFKPFKTCGGLFTKPDIERALDDEASTYTEMVIKGDVGG